MRSTLGKASATRARWLLTVGVRRLMAASNRSTLGSHQRTRASVTWMQVFSTLAAWLRTRA